MKQTRRTTVYDPALGIEAYRLQGFPRPFPPHFHDYYVIGYVEAGTRRMVCGGQAWTVRRGDLLVFQPGEVHACVQAGRGSLSYRGLNVPPAVMEHLAGALTGAAAPPRFSPPVLTDPEAALEAGFADQSHLTHAFSRYLGITPGAYQASFPSAEIRKRG